MPARRARQLVQRDHALVHPAATAGEQAHDGPPLPAGGRDGLHDPVTAPAADRSADEPEVERDHDRGHAADERPAAHHGLHLPAALPGAAEHLRIIGPAERVVVGVDSEVVGQLLEVLGHRGNRDAGPRRTDALIRVTHWLASP
jgi:hypothetical protein